MNINPLLMARLAISVIAVFPGHALAWNPGTYPAAPNRMNSSGFSVNNQDRNDVIAFWNAVYLASEGYQDRIKWNGNYTGNSGTVSDEFAKDVERRLNYFRAMAGVDTRAVVNSNSTVVIDPLDPIKPSASTLKSTAAQNAALMISRNYNPDAGQNPALTHDPSATLAGWSPAAWNATSKGNFAFGLYGPGAITEYMVEEFSSSVAASSWNSLVGHRRWNLYPRSTVYATGDQPGTSAYNPPSNVFYVLQKSSEYLSSTDVGFVAYPAAGFFPVTINSPFWSLSREGADFSRASVSMTDSAGRSIAISNIQRSNDFGDPSIVWKVGGTAGVRTLGNDVTYQVSVTGIVGDGIPSSHSYSVTLINPAWLTSDQRMNGNGKLSAKAVGNFSFVPPAGAEALQVASYRTSSSKWKETAESKPKVIDGTDSKYPLVAPATFPGFSGVAGYKSFRLTFPTTYDLVVRGIPDQTFELDREIIPKSKAKLSFLYRRGYMTPNSILVVEMTSNGGATWTKLGSPITGVSNTAYDSKVSSASVPLPRSSQPIRLRFRYYATGGAIYTHEAAPGSPTGIFIDEIKTSGCDWLEQKKVSTLSKTATGYSFSSKTAGTKLVGKSEWQLRLRAKLGGKWMNYGPAKAVKIVP